MLKKSIQQPFELELVETSSWQASPHIQTYFELVYIRAGTGKQCNNGNKYAYEPGKLFLLRPEDKHNFEVSSPTQFVFIRFTDVYFLQLKDEAERLEFCDWMNKMDYIFHNYHAKAGCIYRNVEDEKFGQALIEGIVREYLRKEPGHLLIIRQSVSILLNLIARNIVFSEPATTKTTADKPSIITIIGYLQQHIYQPELIKMQAIADEFNLSISYLGEYFKKRTGQSIQEYLIDYKLKLVETRLSHSNMRVSEIAQELNFSDESYLSRLFKKHRGITPGAYRKSKKI